MKFDHKVLKVGCLSVQVMVSDRSKLPGKGKQREAHGNIASVACMSLIT